MRIDELFAGVEVLDSNAAPELDICGIVYDSRHVEQGSLFVAITGYNSDGHDYIPAAVKAGAAAILCERVPENCDVPFIQCADTRRAMALAAANFYGNPSREMKIVGVTGTNGKTTTTTLIKSLLEYMGHKVGLIGTNQNMIGDEIVPAERTTPESVELQELFRRMADAGCDYVVMEVSSHALYLSRVDGIEFETGIFTNLTQDHLDFHATMEEYLKAKSKLFTMCRTGIINMDDPSFDYLVSIAECPIFGYAIENASADLSAENVELFSDRVEFIARTSESRDKAILRIPGRFNVYNALCVIAFGSTQGMTMESIIPALEAAKGVKGRAEVAYSDSRYTILIDYAHTPDALENILNTVKGFAKGRTVVLFGCGGDRDSGKRPKMGKIAAELADLVIVTTDNPRTEKAEDIIADILAGMTDCSTPYVVISDRREAIAYAMDNALEGDVIILAGKGHETYQVIGTVKHHLDEREIISEHLSEMNK